MGLVKTLSFIKLGQWVLGRRAETKKESDDYSRPAVLISVWIGMLWSCISIITYRTLFKGFHFYNDWSFTLADKPWTPPSTSSIPIVGPHFFGDFQLPLAYLGLHNPYQLDLPLTLGIGPIALGYLNILNFKGVKFAFILFLLSGFLLIIFSINKAILDMKIATKILLLVISLTFSLPMFIAIDRGNSILIAAPCIFYVIITLQKNQISKSEYIAVLILADLAISFKIYLVMTLILCLALNRTKKTFRIFASIVAFTVSTNTLLSFYYQSNPIQVIRNILKYSAFQSGKGQPDWLLGGVSPLRLFLNVTLHYCHLSNSQCAAGFQKYANLPALIYFVIILCLIGAGTRMTTGQKLTLVMSTISCLPPVAMGYTLIWVPLCFIVLVSEMWKFKGNRWSHAWVFILLFMNLPIPFSGMVPWPIQDWRAIETCLILVLLFLAALQERFLFSQIRNLRGFIQVNSINNGKNSD